MLAMPSSRIGLVGQAEDEPDIKARRLIPPGAEALAYRGRGNSGSVAEAGQVHYEQAGACLASDAQIGANA